jgi:hypothetical protein
MLSSIRTRLPLTQKHPTFLISPRVQLTKMTWYHLQYYQKHQPTTGYLLNLYQPITKLSTDTSQEAKSTDVTKIKSKNYALIMSGGGEEYTEEAEYLTTKCIYTSLTDSKLFESDNIKVLYGDGKADQKTIVAPKEKEKKYHTHHDEFPISQSFVLSNTINQLDHLSKALKAGDSLSIFIDGHGKEHSGVGLYNESHHLSPAILKKQLIKFHPDAKIILHVNSCYSGIYTTLNLPLKNLAVFTSSIHNLPSKYCPGEIDVRTKLFLDYFRAQKSENLLLLHAKGSALLSNHNVYETLCHHIENQIKLFSRFPSKYIFYLKQLYQIIMIEAHRDYHLSIPIDTLKILSMIAFSSQQSIDFLPETAILQRCVTKKYQINSTLSQIKFHYLLKQNNS